MGLEDGALLCVKKPMTVEIARYLWQLVLWEKMRIRKRNELVYNNNKKKNSIGVGEFNGDARSEESHNSVSVVKIKRQRRSQKRRVTLRGKVWTEWTQELHDKFMVAVRDLGEGRCYPKDILELMNEPGLTRMQVASHLQKCRSGNWVPPGKRKGARSSGAKRVFRGKFGFMPAPTSITKRNTTTPPNDEYLSSSAENTVTQPPQDFPAFKMECDAHSVNQTDQNYFDDFPNLDSVIESFSAFQELPITYNMPFMDNDTFKVTSKNRDDHDDNDGNIQVAVKKEEEN